MNATMMDARTFDRPPRRFSADAGNVTAVLGPTNTGKTFLAIERMISHSSGVIGLPLRLLAREVYGKVAARVGVGAVSLITGEEKIKPPNARYSVCTVEAMPRETNAAFLAIDEVQLAGDLERGHVFTDRILHMRGREETMLLGSATMRGVLERLLPGTNFITRPRLSQLVYAGSKKLTRLPRRSAIVGFSAEEVYAIAELIRRQRGGAAVVLGALSPRTRNAQVELYQNGEVDFLVATDAIGMGLNLDVDHVAFAQDWKFDGFQYRRLTAAEFGQIAGRAGRHLRDGTFGVTGQVDPLPDEIVEAVEGHSFPAVPVLQWRSRDLDFASLDVLKESLDVSPPSPSLTRALPSVDRRALEILSRDREAADRVRNRKSVELLWEACKLPDYRRIAPAQHAEIIAQIHADLLERGHVAEDYMAAQVRRADQAEGDIDTLSQRIAEIRTWTYISHRPGWLADPTHWQEKTKGIEDRLSDALHERLTKRFVDRRTSVLMRRMREKSFMEAEIGSDGGVLVEGHPVGELQGFRFTADVKSEGLDAKAVRAAAQKALAGEYEARAERFANAPNGDLALASDGILRWLGAPVATLSAGDTPMRPRVVLLSDEQLTGPARDKVAARAERYVTYQVSTVLKPLADLEAGEGLEGAAKGIAYRLVENFGLLQRRDVAEEVRSLDQGARAALRRLGVRFGAYHIFVPALIKPAPANLLTLLWSVNKDGRDKPGFGEVTQLLATGRTSVQTDPAFDPVFYALAGYRPLGRRAVRVDILERLADLIRPALSWNPGTGKRPDGGYNGREFIVTPAMMSILGATAEDMDEILKGLGYRATGIDAREIEATLKRQDEAAEAARLAEEAKAAAASAKAAAAESASDEAAAVDADAQDPSSEASIDEPAADVPAEGEASGKSEALKVAPSTPADDAAPSNDAAPVAVSEEAALVGREDTAAATAVAAEPAVTEEAAPESAAVEPEVPTTDAAPSIAAAEGETPEEQKLVLVWRPGRMGGERRGNGQEGRPRHRRGQGQGQRSGQAGADAGARPDERKGDAPFRGKGGRPGGGRREDKRFGERDGGERAGGNKPRRDGDGGNRKPPMGEPRRFEKPRAIDPDSPFAKLAALKDKLKK